MQLRWSEVARCSWIPGSRVCSRAGAQRVVRRRWCFGHWRVYRLAFRERGYRGDRRVLAGTPVGPNWLAVNDEELAPGLHSISAPVRSESREVVAAVNIAALEPSAMG